MNETEKEKARAAVREAVHNGTLHKPKRCQTCQKKCPPKLLSGHHHQGYEDALNVVFLCHRCHAILHTGIGQDHAHAKLKNEQVFEIKRLRKVGWKLRELAAKFKVHHVTISKICLGTYWKHFAEF